MSQAIRQLISRGAFAEALSALPEFRALRTDPERLFLRAFAHAALGQIEEARRCAERGIELEPENARFRLLLASVLGASDPQRAQHLYTEIIAIDPNLAEGHAGLAGLAAARGALEQAESLYRTALRAQSAHLPTLLGYAHLLVRLKRPGEALAMVNRVLAQDARNADAQTLAGQILLLSGSLDFARRALDNALAVAPRHAGALLYRARLNLDQGQLEAAARDAGELLKLRPDDQGALLLGAEVALRGHQGDLAVGLLERLVALNPRHEQAVLKLADLRAATDPRGAAQLLGRHARLLPEAAALWRAELGLLNGQGQFGIALAEAQAWTELAPQQAAAWDQAALLAEFAEQLDSARAAASRAIALDPQQLDATLVLARAALHDGQPQAALALLDGLAGAPPAGLKRNELERVRGRALLDLERLPEALQAFRAAAAAEAMDSMPAPLRAEVTRGSDGALEAGASHRPVWFLVGNPGSGVDAIGRFLAAQDDCYVLTDRFGREPRRDLLAAPERLDLGLSSGQLEMARSRYLRALERLQIPADLQLVDWLPQLDVRVFDLLRVLLPNARFIIVQRDPRDALVQAVLHAAFGPAYADPAVLATAISAQTRHLAQMLTTAGGPVVSVGFEQLLAQPEAAVARLAQALERAPFGSPELIQRMLRDRGGLPKYLPGGGWQRFAAAEALGPALQRF